MTTALSYVVGTRNTRLNDAWDLVNGGTLKIYSGAVPANADAALSGNTLLSTLTFANPAFSAAAAGVKTANAIAQDPNAAATGVATFWRAFNGAAVVAQGTVGTSGESLNLGTTNINAGDVVQVSSFVVTEAP